MTQGSVIHFTPKWSSMKYRSIQIYSCLCFSIALIIIFTNNHFNPNLTDKPPPPPPPIKTPNPLYTAILHFNNSYYATMSTSSQSTQVFFDFTPHLIVYADGHINRLQTTEFVKPGTDPETGVRSNDIVISPENNISARIFLPRSASPDRKLPLLVFYHGGGFLVESAFSPLYTRHLNRLVSVANVVAVSVEYRLAPEYYLPVGYEDSWLALKWIVTDSGSETWVRDFADMDRVFLGGDSAGANIAHQMAMRVGLEKSGGIRIRGMFLNCPFFLGKDFVGREEEYYSSEGHFKFDRLWIGACPNSSGLDDPWINPGMDPEISKLGCGRVLVHVGSEDGLRDRGLYYKEVLERSAWKGDVEVVDVEGEGHVWSVANPTTENAVAMLRKVAQFMNDTNAD